MDTIKKIWNRIVNVVDNKIIKFKLPKTKCNGCIKNAVWKNSISGVCCCDECVPRGCSCRLYKKVKRAVFFIDNYDYKKNKNKLEFPCEDWEKI